jgi:hypothetical protein
MFYKSAGIYDLIKWGKAFFNTAYLARLLLQDSVHKYFRLYKATVCVYIFLELSDLPADWILDGGLGCVHTALVMYTQAHRCEV